MVRATVTVPPLAGCTKLPLVLVEERACAWPAGTASPGARASVSAAVPVRSTFVAPFRRKVQPPLMIAVTCAVYAVPPTVIDHRSPSEFPGPTGVRSAVVAYVVFRVPETVAATNPEPGT